MKKSVSLILALCIIGSVLCGSVACAKVPDAPEDNGAPSGDDPTTPLTVLIPEGDSYPGHALLSLSDTVYDHPDYDALIGNLRDTADDIAASALSCAETLDALKILKKKYDGAAQAYELCALYRAKDPSSAFFREKYLDHSAHRIDLDLALEELCTACADSPYAPQLEQSFFGEGALKPYEEKLLPSDTVTALKKREAAIVAEYTCLCPATVKITYHGTTDYASALFAAAEEKYSDKTSQSYRLAIATLNELCDEAYAAERGRLYTELVQLRAVLAEENGCSDYLSYLCGTALSLSETECRNVEDGILKNVLSAYDDLYSTVFSSALTGKRASECKKEECINLLTEKLKDLGDGFYLPWSYLLNSSLASFPAQSDGAKSFSAYLSFCGAPYLSAACSDTTVDYITVAQTLADCILNYNLGTDVSEEQYALFSYALPLLAVLALSEEELCADGGYLENYLCNKTFTALLHTGLLTRFEMAVYSLPRTEITEEKISSVLRECARAYGINAPEGLSLGALLSDTFLPSALTAKLFTSPMSCVRTACGIGGALEIYCAQKSAKAGQEMLDALLVSLGEMPYCHAAAAVGLCDPTDAEGIATLTDTVYYTLRGKHRTGGFSSDANA